jgi:hypothetical protein
MLVVVEKYSGCVNLLKYPKRYYLIRPKIHTERQLLDEILLQATQWRKERETPIM